MDPPQQRQQLLRPHPQFTGIGGAVFDGSSTYHSGQFKAEKPFAKGYTILMSYTISDNREQVSFLNEQDVLTGLLEDRQSGGDRRHRGVISGIWELPFGEGRRWGSSWNRVAETIVGGWQVQGIGQFQTGRPLNFDANYLFRGDPGAVATDGELNIDRRFNTDGFERNAARQLSWNYRTAPRQFTGLRSQGLHLWDISAIKHFSLGNAFGSNCAVSSSMPSIIPNSTIRNAIRPTPTSVGAPANRTCLATSNSVYGWCSAHAQCPERNNERRHRRMDGMRGTRHLDFVRDDVTHGPVIQVFGSRTHLPQDRDSISIRV
jgi:hypothetical protein